MRFLAQRYGIDMSQTVAMGDNLNDLSMIEAAGIGVAVGNAVRELKRKATMSPSPTTRAPWRR